MNSTWGFGFDSWRASCSCSNCYDAHSWDWNARPFDDSMIQTTTICVTQTVDDFITFPDINNSQLKFFERKANKIN